MKRGNRIPYLCFENSPLLHPILVGVLVMEVHQNALVYSGRHHEKLRLAQSHQDGLLAQSRFMHLLEKNVTFIRMRFSTVHHELCLYLSEI